MEGIVAKPVESSYGLIKGRARWWKITNPNYSQAEGRGEISSAATRIAEAKSGKEEVVNWDVLGAATEMLGRSS